MNLDMAKDKSKHTEEMVGWNWSNIDPYLGEYGENDFRMDGVCGGSYMHQNRSSH